MHVGIDGGVSTRCVSRPGRRLDMHTCTHACSIPMHAGCVSWPDLSTYAACTLYPCMHAGGVSWPDLQPVPCTHTCMQAASHGPHTCIRTHTRRLCLMARSLDMPPRNGRRRGRRGTGYRAVRGGGGGRVWGRVAPASRPLLYTSGHAGRGGGGAGYRIQGRAGGRCQLP